MKINLVMESRESDGEFIVRNITALKKQNSDCVVYKFIDEFGKSTIEIFKNSVIISREGAVNNTLILKKGMTTPLDYDIGAFSTSIDLFTKELEISDKKFNAAYVLYQDGQFLNNVSISIYEK